MLLHYIFNSFTLRLEVLKYKNSCFLGRPYQVTFGVKELEVRTIAYESAAQIHLALVAVQPRCGAAHPTMLANVTDGSRPRASRIYDGEVSHLDLASRVIRPC